MNARLAPLHYFAYGSNMNPARVADRKLPILGKPMFGQLFGYALRFNKISRTRPGSASANIMPCLGQSVEGVVYCLTETNAIESMDVFENSPIDYARKVVFVRVRAMRETEGFDLLPAWTYIAKAHAIDEHVKPTREYVGHLLASPFILEGEAARLRAIECIDD